MRSAEEILHSIAPHLNMDGSSFKLCIKAINEARIELVKEIADKTHTSDHKLEPVIFKYEILSLLTSIK